MDTRKKNIITDYLVKKSNEVFYSQDIYTINAAAGMHDSSNVADNFKQYKLCIFNMSTECWGSGLVNAVYDGLARQDINFILFSHDPIDHNKKPGLLFIPWWYYHSMVPLKKFDRCGSLYLHKKYKWSCYAQLARNHRIYNYIYSRKQSYFADSCFAMTCTMPGAPDPKQIVLDEEIVNEWENIKHQLPIHDNHPALSPTELDTNSYIHLVTETTIKPDIFVTEKTWIPVASERIFLIFGGPGTVKFLRDQGVDVFDDIIDHAYDLEPDWKIRCHKVHQQLEKLLSMDLMNLYVDTQHRRESNRNKFFSGEFGQPYLKTVFECIDQKIMLTNSNYSI